MSNKLFYSISFLLVFCGWYLLINPLGDKVEFNSENWQAVDFSSSEYLFTRWEMVEDLQNNHLFMGMTKVEVVDLLGKPEIQPEGDFHYILGHSKNDKGTGSLILVFNGTDAIVDYYIWDS